MKILYLSSEVAPFSKTGGLGDVAGSVPKALWQKGMDILVVTPAYRSAISAQGMQDKGQISMDGGFSFILAGRKLQVNVMHSAPKDGPKVIFLDIDGLFDRDGLYGNGKEEFSDNPYRFGLFSRASVELCLYLNSMPDVIHANEWQTAASVYYSANLEFSEPRFKDVATLLTIHNLAYQGVIPSRLAPSLELNAPMGPSHLATGIFWADVLSTVSPSYRKEILNPGRGMGMHTLLKARRKDLFGILNGADYEKWNPEKDPYIPANYSIKDLSGKRTCKKELLREFRLPQDIYRPLFVIPARLTGQKGWHLMCSACKKLVKMGASVAMMGEGEPQYEAMLRYTAHTCRPYVSFLRGYSEDLAHLMQAGGDCLVMPSEFEPCGLTQLYAMKYGTIPVVHDVGGLRDTIVDPLQDRSGATGFKFGEYNRASFLSSIARCLRYYNNKPAWRRLMINAMAKDYSWSRAARNYISLYWHLKSKK
ncbi:MAG: glycogen synthase [Deltaproteobacteria bacterium]|nr:glycogen synthase [Deltaproteobacteria bacterium]